MRKWKLIRKTINMCLINIPSALQFYEFLKEKINNELITSLYEEFSVKNTIIPDEVEEKPHRIMTNTCNNLVLKQNKKSIWDTSFFGKINELSADYTGKLGELYILDIVKKIHIPYVYTDDVNSKDGTYDIILYDKKTEIKTAKRGTLRSTFQHENLRNQCCDYYIFIDIAPEYLYFTILPSFDLKTTCKIIGRTPHLRKGTTNVFKFDFTEKNLEKSISKSYTIKISIDTPMTVIKSFIYNSYNRE